jgi:threonine dehydrogenase-like Zn-dependent dehydrogenase
MQLWNWRGFDVINAHERDPAIAVQGMREAVSAIESGLIDPKLLITHRYPLQRLDEALNATRDRPGNFVKSVVVPA